MKSTIVYSRRRTLAITVNDAGEVVVRAPKGTCVVSVEKYLLKHQDWIIKQQEKASKRINKIYSVDFDADKVVEYKKSAEKEFKLIAEILSSNLNLKYSKFRISSAKKRWGSCNSEKTISINWKLWFAPRHLKEYVILHELAHLKHMNHSSNFWNFIEKHMPDYRSRRKELKDYEYLLLLSA